jgi:hypothetical protein
MFKRLIEKDIGRIDSLPNGAGKGHAKKDLHEEDHVKV